MLKLSSLSSCDSILLRLNSLCTQFISRLPRRVSEPVQRSRPIASSSQFHSEVERGLCASDGRTWLPCRFQLHSIRLPDSRDSPSDAAPGTTNPAEPAPCRGKPAAAVGQSRNRESVPKQRFSRPAGPACPAEDHFSGSSRYLDLLHIVRGEQLMGQYAFPGYLVDGQHFLCFTDARSFNPSV